jgi:dolichol-phosphate mannosyltransferase
VSAIAVAQGLAPETAPVPRPRVPERGPAPIVYVVPAYNEEENLPRLLSDLEAHPELVGPRDRVIIVDDGSVDGTAALIEGYGGPLSIELVKMGENQGPGAAFRAGFAAALRNCSDDALVVTLEADTTSDLEALPHMLACTEAGAELVLASVHGGGQMLNVGPFRRLLSRSAGYVVRSALGTDASTVSSFFRVYRASLLAQASEHYGENLIRERGFACKAELLVKLTSLGARIEEVPVDLDGARRIGESKMPVLGTLAGYWRLVVRSRFRSEPASA